MALIRITDLKIKTIIGINAWERNTKQDIIINAIIEYDAARAVKSDKITDTIDYKTITKKIIAKVKGSKYFLLEKLTAEVLNLILSERNVISATVRIDKPKALRFAKSVSVELFANRKS